MSEIKEKPKMGTPKSKDRDMLVPKQAARLLASKLQRQPDQDNPEAETNYATGQVQGAATRTTQTLTDKLHGRPCKRQHKGKSPSPTIDTAPSKVPSTYERQRAAPPKTPRTRDGQSAVSPKTPHTFERQSAVPPKVPNAFKRRNTTSPEPPSVVERRKPAQRTDLLRTTEQTPRDGQAPTQSTLYADRRGVPAARREAGTGTGHRAAQRTAPDGHAIGYRRAGGIKERPQATAATLKKPLSTKGPTASAMPKERPHAQQRIAKLMQRSRRTAHSHVKQRMVAQAQKAAQRGAVMIKRIAEATARAVASLISSLIALAGGGVLLVVLLVVIVIAAVASSPFGIFFAGERSAPDAMSASEAVAAVNIAYNAELEELQSGDYDDIIIHGQAADWTDVLAVFAVKTAGADVDGMDVATLDATRLEKLTAVFWDMTALAAQTETINHPGETEDEPGSTEYIRHIYITAKTADDMRTVYSFTEYQNAALDELLADRAALSGLAGSLTITSADVKAILDALPRDLSPARREAVKTALSLVGKVSYFWGGKSAAIGWDSRWGTLQKVWAAGSSTTGTYRPFGLDCSGFVDWVFNNSLGYVIGHGGGVATQRTYCTAIPESEAQPGDLAFYSDDSHIGIVVGWDENGDLLICHCNTGANNVSVSGYAASGFSSVGQPDIFD